MRSKYDTIIIGSGLGGLMTALILAKEGRKVAIVEKNKQFGGNLQSFFRDGVLFDTGVHYVGSLEKGQPLHNYFSKIHLSNILKYNKKRWVKSQFLKKLE